MRDEISQLPRFENSQNVKMTLLSRLLNCANPQISPFHVFVIPEARKSRRLASVLVMLPSQKSNRDITWRSHSGLSVKTVAFRRCAERHA